MVVKRVTDLLRFVCVIQMEEQAQMSERLTVSYMSLYVLEKTHADDRLAVLCAYLAQACDRLVVLCACVCVCVCADKGAGSGN